MKLSQITNYSDHPSEHAQKLLNGKNHRVIANNTKMWGSGGYARVELHGHSIIQIQPYVGVQLYSCGYRTVTTKDRMNRFLPNGTRVFQKDHVWYLTDYLGTRRFHDGIKVRFP